MNRLLQFPVALLILFCLSGCNDDRKWSWHQKLTITVMTPSGMKIASSVQRGTIEKYGWWQHQWGYDGSEYVTGESVVLEVAPGKYLFALLSSTPRAWTVFVPNEEFRESAGPALAALRETREVSQKDYPLLVTFEDINDPTSIRRVDPQRLDAVFGAGYRLNSITMSITDEPETKGPLETILKPWLQRRDEKGRIVTLRYADKSPRGYDTLSSLDFWSLYNIPD